MCFSTTMNQWEELNLMTNVWGEKEKKGDILVLILTKLRNDTRNDQIYLCNFPFLIYWNYILLYFSICVAVTSYVKKKSQIWNDSSDLSYNTLRMQRQKFACCNSYADQRTQSMQCEHASLHYSTSMYGFLLRKGVGGLKHLNHGSSGHTRHC